MSADDDSVFLVLCTAPENEAATLADQLLEERLAACVNLIGPMTSRYRWEGRIEEGREMLLLIKTTAGKKSALRRRIVDLHSYSVPEVLEFAVDSGLPAYLGWVADSCEN
jgi:periplasmic divalent cation tolerance protein